MIKGKFILALTTAALLAATGAAFAQPQSKLTSQLNKGLIQATWCSALLFEKSFEFDEASEDAIRFEELAFDLGGAIDTALLEDNGLRQTEVDEIWALFDDAAFNLALDDPDSFTAQMEMCETNYDDLI